MNDKLLDKFKMLALEQNLSPSINLCDTSNKIYEQKQAIRYFRRYILYCMRQLKIVEPWIL